MSKCIKHLTFVADEEVLALIAELKADLRAPTTAAIFRKALSFTKLACDEAKSSNGLITIRGKNDTTTSGVTVSLRAY